MKTKTNGKHVTAVETPTSPQVVPAGATPLTSVLPDVVQLRCSYADSSEEMLFVVAEAFGMGKQCDPRLEFIDRERTRGHTAYPVEPPRAALVRNADARLVTLCSETPEHAGQVHGLNIEAIASLFTDRRGQLRKEPQRATHALSPESRARVVQVLDGLSDDEALNLYRPMSEQGFNETSAERVVLDSCMAFRPGSRTGTLWVRFRDLLWPISLVRGEPLRKIEQEVLTDSERGRRWNHSPTRGII